MLEKDGIDFTSIILEGVELKSCRRSHQSYKKHLHHELSIGIIREGASTVEFGEMKYIFCKGDGVIIPPRMSHMCSPDDIEHWRFEMLYIDSEYYGDGLQFNCVSKIEGPGAQEIEDFLSLVQEEKNENIIEEQLINLLVSLEEKTQKAGFVYDNDSCEKIKSYIENNYRDKLNLEQLQTQFGINRFSIIRNFKKHYNTTPIAYQLQLKVAQAKAYMLEGMDVFDICSRLDFYDQAHFIKEFKKMNGVTPMAYLNNIYK